MLITNLFVSLKTSTCWHGSLGSMGAILLMRWDGEFFQTMVMLLFGIEG
jgi:hypothetical protein